LADYEKSLAAAAVLPGLADKYLLVPQSTTTAAAAADVPTFSSHLIFSFSSYLTLQIMVLP
jgi:hypothetical protein